MKHDIIRNRFDKICCLDEIKETGVISYSIQSKYFPPEWSFGKIRDWLEENDLDRHMPIELSSTEIAICTPFGVLMQIRPSDNDQLGMWGGVLKAGEQPIDGAVRELKEETGIEVKAENLEFIEIDEHEHQYTNGDIAYFMTYRYRLSLNYVPKVTTDEESVGAVMVAHTIISHQQDFIRRMLDELPKKS